ncbi:Alg9 family protein mannosyltransferase [Chloroherpeton thalassium ATCC 35110]|uniref:Alg9 family protein mannosyltransferase n=1 Tax=Chloroherpeton thalassium (strain ATCC 35110 / GB-78) TaxID=517418 RepID=B3QYP8_CHLT3|nr:glycosyltransferase family 39 protein [Chloroherpeton thalassium]ACF15121.1 Alg9 family protein mannosyltransferase [Chloroherpeton thalassium ATCC 35110]
MKTELQHFFEEKTLTSLILIALIVRLLAAIFSKGFGMFDDHFLAIEVAQRWADGYNDWFNRGIPAGHSIIYPGLHYLLFKFLDAMSLTDPQDKMLIVRLIHAVYSTLTVAFAYKTTEILSGKSAAKTVGLIIGLFWVFPFMSVRNLIEFVCIPPLMISFYYIAKNEKEKTYLNTLLAGVFMGFSFMFRYQILLILGGVGLVFLFRKEVTNAFLYGIGFLISAFLTQGVVDWIAWGYPFAAIYAYFDYNLHHSQNYPSGFLGLYTLLLLGVFIPPTSFLYAWGYFKSFKKYVILAFPALIFLIFHSIFPNQQERFVLPATPLFIISGVIGFQELQKKYQFISRDSKILKAAHIWFWTINIILLFAFTFHYSKKSRVETVYYFHNKPDVHAIIFDHARQPPIFYMDKWVEYYRVENSEDWHKLKTKIQNKEIIKPNYAVFLGQKNIEERVKTMNEVLNVKTEIEKEIEPSFLDNILYRLNPKRNRNRTSYIYKIDW